ncbi:MAG: hypothetical protein ACI31M_05035 [Bacilli bacterium]
MKSFVKKNGKFIFGFAIGAVFFLSITVYAVSFFSAEEIKYNDTSVQTALDDLFNKSSNGSTKYDASQVTLTTSYNSEVQTLQDALDDLYSKKEGN